MLFETALHNDVTVTDQSIRSVFTSLFGMASAHLEPEQR